MSDTMQGFMWKFVTPLLRHGLSLGAGWLASRGVLAGDKETEFVDVGLSLLLGLGAYGLSVWDKHKDEAKTDKAVEIALKEPTPPPGPATEAKVEEVKAQAAEAVKVESK